MAALEARSEPLAGAERTGTGVGAPGNKSGRAVPHSRGGWAPISGQAVPPLRGRTQSRVLKGWITFWRNPGTRGEVNSREWRWDLPLAEAAGEAERGASEPRPKGAISRSGRGCRAGRERG